MSQPGWSQSGWGQSGWGRPTSYQQPAAPRTVWNTTPNPPYVWPFGQGPDHSAAAPPGGMVFTGWGPPQTTWGPPRPRRRKLPYLIGSLIVLVALAFGGLALVTTATGNGLVYRNDGYVPPEPEANPPALPRAGTIGEAERLTEDNALYAQRVPSPIRCTMGRLTATASEAELTERANELTACLMRAWEDPVRDAGYELYRPTVSVFSAKTDSACGDLDPDNAAYCSSDQQIYLGTGLVRSFADTPIVVDMILAHEFGHLIQARTGVLLGTRSLQQSASSSERLRLNRRIELQADCFAGLWIHAVSRSMDWGDDEHDDFATAAESAGDRPDRDGDHGRGSSREYWLRQGLATNDIGVCNTFRASDDRVE